MSSNELMLFVHRSTFERELKYLEKVFYEKNNYPKYIVKQILDKAFKEHNRKNATNTTLDEQNKTEHTTEKKHVLILPYQGKKRRLFIKSVKNRFRNLLPKCIVLMGVFTGNKLSSKFQVKDRTIFRYNHDIIYDIVNHDITMLEKLPEEFDKGCYTTLEKTSVAIFISTLSRQVIKRWR